MGGVYNRVPEKPCLRFYFLFLFFVCVTHTSVGVGHLFLPCKGVREIPSCYSLCPGGGCHYERFLGPAPHSTTIMAAETKLIFLVHSSDVKSACDVTSGLWHEGGHFLGLFPLQYTAREERLPIHIAA